VVPATKTRLLVRPRALLAAGVLALVVVTGCGGGRASAGAGTTASVTEQDFRISAPAHVKTGDVTFRVHNKGPDEHELIIVPLRRAQLPLRTDGFTINEEAIQRTEPGSLDPGRPGSVRYLTVHLAPGRYVLFCNMAGHFMGGMHAIVDVTS
jgi:uncharacterized cupredoxin-like copper-binding protein